MYIIGSERSHKARSHIRRQIFLALRNENSWLSHIAYFIEMVSSININRIFIYNSVVNHLLFPQVFEKYGVANQMFYHGV